jgi:hypothetical protein
MAHGVTEKVDVGGDGGWTGGRYGGMSYVGDFTQTFAPNIVFVFSENLASNNVPGSPVYTGDAISHEVGHSFGLNHQSTYSGTSLIQEYSTGPGDGTAPIMGSSYAAARSLWWDGQSDISSTIYQDDMAVIASLNNGFGYRPEPGNTTPLTAAALAVTNGSQVSGSGLIIHPSDLDYFSFTSGPGLVSFTVSVTAGVNNLAPKVELLAASGSTPIAWAGPFSTDFSASITATLPSSGSYRILVTSSDGHYGNVGQYSINGTIQDPANPAGGAGPGTGTGSGSVPGAGPLALTPPSSLTAVAVNPYVITVTWTNVPGATGFAVLRITSGANWTLLATTGAGVTSFSDQSVAPQTAYAYAICATRSGQTSAPSVPAWTSTPGIPVPPSAVTGLAVISLAPRQVVLGWQPSSGAQGYQIERTSNGRTWTVVGRVNGDGSCTFTDSSVGPLKTYAYRIRAFNAYGFGPVSRSTRVVTPRISAIRPLKKKAH